MIVKPIKISQKDTHTKVSVDISWLNSNKVDKLWYSFPSIHCCAEDLNHDAFLISLLPIAMQIEEAIHICGSVSPEIVYNLREYQKLMAYTYTNFKIVPITYESIAEQKCNKTEGVMCSYSGGVDSTFTLMQHLPTLVPETHKVVTHALFIENFDVDPEGVSETRQRADFDRFLSTHNVTLVPLITNIRKLYSEANVPITPTYSAIVCGASMLFYTEVKTFCFSADFTYDSSNTFGINHLVTPLLSSEYFSIKYFGGSYSRFEKLNHLAKWPAIHDKLFVCHNAIYTNMNCGKCDKCLLTIIALELEGIRHLFYSFPKNIDRNALRSFIFNQKHISMPKLWLQAALKKKRYDIAYDLCIAIFRSAVLIRFESPLSPIYKISFILRSKFPLYNNTLDKLKTKFIYDYPSV